MFWYMTSCVPSTVKVKNLWSTYTTLYNFMTCSLIKRRENVNSTLYHSLTI